MGYCGFFFTLCGVSCLFPLYIYGGLCFSIVYGGRVCAFFIMYGVLCFSIVYGACFSIVYGGLCFSTVYGGL